MRECIMLYVLYLSWVCVCVYTIRICFCVCVRASSNIGRVSALTRATSSAAHIAAAVVQVYYNIIIIVVRTRFFVFNRRRRAYDDNANEVDTIPTALLYNIICIVHRAYGYFSKAKKKTNIPFRLNSARYTPLYYHIIVRVQSVYIGTQLQRTATTTTLIHYYSYIYICI